MIDIYIYYIRTLSFNIIFTCTRFSNRKTNSETLASLSLLVGSECKYKLYSRTMYVHILQFQTNHTFVRFMIQTDTKDRQDIPTWFKADVKEVKV